MSKCNSKRNSRLPFEPLTRSYFIVPANCSFCSNSHYASEQTSDPALRGVIYCDALKEFVFGACSCMYFRPASTLIESGEYICELDKQVFEVEE